MMTLAEFLRLFPEKPRKKTAKGVLVVCPAHADNDPSLHVSAAAKDGIILFCQSGCDTRNVLSAVGKTFADISASNGHKPSKTRPKIETAYDYRDESGELIYQVVRYEGKDFKQRRPNGKGRWAWNLEGVNRTLYRLPELLASDSNEYVFIAEGEKDVENLRGLGLIATCNSGGAGKWPAPESRHLSNRIAIILPDNDQKGEDHAAEVFSAIGAHAKDATRAILRLPGLPEKGDVSDWINSGGTAGDLRKLAEAALTNGHKPPPPVKAKPDRPEGGLRFSDYENAERMIRRHGENIRYCGTWKKWLVWKETHWQEDDTQEIVRLGKETVRRIYAEAADTEDSADRKALVSHARKSEARGRIVAMIGLSESEPGIPVTPDQLDATESLLPCPNGTVDLKTGELMEPSRAHYLTKLCATKYVVDAQCPKWEAFLNRIFQNQSPLIQFVQRIAGYSLTGDVSERCLFILYGIGRNGKSTLLETVARVIGDRYATTTTADLLLSKPAVGDLTTAAYMASLKGYRMVSCSETEDGKRLAESAVKSMTGNEKISAMHKYSDPFSYKPQFKVWLATNHKPEIRGTDEAIWDRIKLVPFQVRIPDHEVNRNLLKELLSESEGILAWMIRGCLDWRENGLNVPADVKSATSSYRGEMDVFQSFIEDRLIAGPEYQCQASKLYEEYKKWCESTGEFCQKQRWFGQRLSDRGYEPKKGTNGTRFWQGLDINRTSFDSGASA